MRNLSALRIPRRIPIRRGIESVAFFLSGRVGRAQSSIARKDKSCGNEREKDGNGTKKHLVLESVCRWWKLNFSFPICSGAPTTMRIRLADDRARYVATRFIPAV